MSAVIYLLIALFVFVFIFLLLFKILKTVVKIVFSLLFLFVLIFAIMGYFVYSDIKDIEQSFADSTNLYLLEDNTQLIYGFKAKGFGLLEKDILPQEELLDLQQNYDTTNYQAMLQHNYKILIFKKELIGDVKTEELADAFDEVMQEQGPAFIYKGFKEGNIIIYPETAFFKFLKFIPDFIAGRMRMFE